MEPTTTTVGVSPKVKLPAWAITIVGVVLLVIGYAIGDDHVQAVGWGLLGTGPLAGILGWLAPPGQVVPVDNARSIPSDVGDAGAARKRRA